MSCLDKDIYSISLNTADSHFFHLYKNEGKIKDYKERMRKDVDGTRLKERKNNFDLNRALNIPDEEDKMANNCFYRKTGKSKNKWANLMMLAEWFMLIPEEFHDSYCMKLCPVGKHVLMVSEKVRFFGENNGYIMADMNRLTENDADFQ